MLRVGRQNIALNGRPNARGSLMKPVSLLTSMTTTTLVYLHGMLPHYSAANRSARAGRLFLARVRRALRLVGAELFAARAGTTAARARSRGAWRRGGAVTPGQAQTPTIRARFCVCAM
jgi:hypothetical protein